MRGEASVVPLLHKWVSPLKHVFHFPRIDEIFQVSEKREKTICFSGPTHIWRREKLTGVHFLVSASIVILITIFVISKHKIL